MFTKTNHGNEVPMPAKHIEIKRCVYHDDCDAADAIVQMWYGNSRVALHSISFPMETNGRQYMALYQQYMDHTV